MYVEDASGAVSRTQLAGGYNVPVAGAPSAEVVTPELPDRLFVPLESRRFDFSELRVVEGQRVERGAALAVDPLRFSVPLLAPCAGTVRLSAAEGHVVLEDLEVPAADAAPAGPAQDADGAAAGLTASRLVELGVWQFFSDARSGAPVDPGASPDVVVVPVARLEPFAAGGEVLLAGGIDRFARGLTSLHGLFPEAAVCVVLPDTDHPLAAEAKRAARECGCARLLSVPLRYPFDHPGLVARLSGLVGEPGREVWALSLQGLLALDEAAARSRPCTERVISVAGPAVSEPLHMRVMTGHPIDDVLDGRLRENAVRVVVGGLLTGRTLPEGRRGIDVECEGLTVLGELTERTFMAFARPGVRKRSYSRTFVGNLSPELGVRYDTGLAGELRPCIACGQCVDVCPARIMPNALHRALYAGDLERATDLRVDLCVECGLCSFVCPSKIDLREQFIRAKAEIEADTAAAAALEAEA